jgi:hypothetical protein
MATPFSYALAKSLNAPLLFKGPDLSHTDVTPAAPIEVAGPGQAPRREDSGRS